MDWGEKKKMLLKLNRMSLLKGLSTAVMFPQVCITQSALGKQVQAPATQEAPKLPHKCSLNLSSQMSKFVFLGVSISGTLTV